MASKNVHMEHIEDLIFNEGVVGARKAVFFLRDLKNMLGGHSHREVNVTVKWDGAPAIFAGIDPADGQFFVAKKGVFNVRPDIYKTPSDLAKLSPELKSKFTVALKEFPKLGITEGVYQGDLMFTKGDLKVERIDGQSGMLDQYYTFQPNTIVYAVPVKSKLGKSIKRANIGVVWHTTYTGDSLQTMRASFGKNIASKLKQPNSVWQEDATYKDVAGTATFTRRETEILNKMLSDAGKLFRSTPASMLNAIAEDEDLKIRIKTYNNSKVREGKPFSNPRQHVRGLYDFINAWYANEISKKKTPRGKKTWEDKRTVVMAKVFSRANDLVKLFTLMNQLVVMKLVIINKLNKASDLGTFLRTASGLRVTNHEGFVAIDDINGAVKLVDRLEFSRANFSPDILKGWQK
jgi:hypothetical protein